MQTAIRIARILAVAYSDFRHLGSHELDREKKSVHSTKPDRRRFQIRTVSRIIYVSFWIGQLQIIALKKSKHDSTTNELYFYTNFYRFLLDFIATK